MKNLILLFLILGSPVFADSLNLAVAGFYSRGEYSNSQHSNDFSLYTTLSLNSKYFLSLSGTDIQRNENQWKYNQQMFTGSLYFYEFPYSFQGSYSYIPGKYEEKTSAYTYHEYGNLLHVSARKIFPEFILGFGYTYFTQTGNFSDKSVKSWEMYLERYLHWRLFASVRPLFTRNYDGEGLFSTTLKVNYLPFYGLFLKFSLTAGERSHFFDNELFTFHNQEEKQKFTASISADYYFGSKFAVSPGFFYTEFETFKVNYFIVGLKAFF